MIKRWKPSTSYYYIDTAGGVNRSSWDYYHADWERYEFGNCFETKEQAEDAVTKIRELLLSMAGESATSSDRLPKLTAEVFNRPDCPEWAKWVAVFDNGEGFYYENKPSFNAEEGGWFHTAKRMRKIKSEFDAADWQSSLIERPVKEDKLPDWCKVGEWVYSTEPKEYVKIKDIDEFEVKFDRGFYCAVSHKAFREDYKPARPRPYNVDEMQELVGKVLKLDGNLDLVTSYDKDSKVVYADSMWMKADELLSNGYTIDGEPCGVLEHLENGEWVQ